MTLFSNIIFSRMFRHTNRQRHAMTRNYALIHCGILDLQSGKWYVYESKCVSVQSINIHLLRR